MSLCNDKIGELWKHLFLPYFEHFLRGALIIWISPMFLIRWLIFLYNFFNCNYSWLVFGSRFFFTQWRGKAKPHVLKHDITPNKRGLVTMIIHTYLLKQNKYLLWAYFLAMNISPSIRWILWLMGLLSFCFWVFLNKCVKWMLQNVYTYIVHNWLGYVSKANTTINWGYGSLISLNFIMQICSRICYRQFY